MRRSTLFYFISTFIAVSLISGCGDQLDENAGFESEDGDPADGENPPTGQGVQTEQTDDPCQIDAHCPSDDACKVGSCDGASATCVFSTLDGDGDGDPPPICGGTDCDDSDPTTHSFYCEGGGGGGAGGGNEGGGGDTPTPTCEDETLDGTWRTSFIDPTARFRHDDFLRNKNADPLPWNTTIVFLDQFPDCSVWLTTNDDGSSANSRGAIHGDDFNGTYGTFNLPSKFTISINSAWEYQEEMRELNCTGAFTAPTNQSEFIGEISGECSGAYPDLTDEAHERYFDIAFTFLMQRTNENTTSR